MSFILDALKRSERARRVLGASAAPPAIDPPAPARRGWVLGAVLLLLLVDAALLGWWLLRPEPTPAVAVAPTAGEVRSLAREAGGASAAAEPGTTAPSRAEYATSAASATPLAEVEPALRARLETLHVDVHGWADEPAQRFVIINLKRRVAGDALDGGATLVEIVVDGAVVELDGRRVLLPRQ
jgi:hypothetical protein